MGSSRNLVTVRSGSPGRLRLTALGNSARPIGGDNPEITARPSRQQFRAALERSPS